MRYWYDTEFLERGPGHPISLISIGVVAEDGREFYAVNKGAPWSKIQINDWLMGNVVPFLPVKVDDNGLLAPDFAHDDAGKIDFAAEIGYELYKFLTADDEAPELWAWYGAYDHVVLSQLYGTMQQMGVRAPKIPWFTNDVKQEHVRLGGYRIPVQKANEHHALADALWCRDVHYWLITKGL